MQMSGLKKVESDPATTHGPTDTAPETSSSAALCCASSDSFVFCFSLFSPLDASVQV